MAVPAGTISRAVTVSAGQSDIAVCGTTVS